jgi:hypothetical protein
LIRHGTLFAPGVLANFILSESMRISRVGLNSTLPYATPEPAAGLARSRARAFVERIFFGGERNQQGEIRVANPGRAP